MNDHEKQSANVQRQEADTRGCWSVRYSEGATYYFAGEATAREYAEVSRQKYHSVGTVEYLAVWPRHERTLTDADRLDWLQKHAPSNGLSLEVDSHRAQYEVWTEGECIGRGDSLREALDAAMKQKEASK